MKKVLVSIASNLMLNVNPGEDVEAVIDGDGVVYFPLMNVKNVINSSDSPKIKEAAEKPEPKKETPPIKKEPETKEETSSETKVYTESELQKITPASNLIELIEQNFPEFDLDETTGSNTNKKLRKIYLELQDGQDPLAGEEKEEKKEPTKKSRGSSSKKEEKSEPLTEEKIIQALSDSYAIADSQEDIVARNKEIIFDNLEVEKSEVEAIENILEDQASVFFDDSSIDPGDMGIETYSLIIGEEEEGAQEEKEEESEELSYEEAKAQLKKGDKVSVFWPLENDGKGEWVDGEVSKIARGKGPVILYEDDTEETLDPEQTTAVIIK